MPISLVVIAGCGQEKSELPRIGLSCLDEIGERDVICTCSSGDAIFGTAEVRTRGNSSLKYPKKSMRLELDSSASFCGLPAHDVWVLNAGYIDKSFIRHRLSFDLFRAMGTHNLAPNGCYSEVFIDEQYHGLYYVMQRIDAERAGISSRQPGGVIFKEPPVFIQEERGVEYPEHPFGQKYPEVEERDETPLAEELRDFLFHAPDSVFYAEIGAWFHLENVADWMLLLLFTNNTDGLLRNFYLYRLHVDSPFRIAIWDYDETFGRYGDNRLNNIETDLEWERNPLLSRLFERRHFRDLLKERWLHHRKNALQEQHINERINEYVEILKPNVGQNFERWPVSGPGYTDDNGFKEEVEFIRDFISARLQELDERIAGW